LALCEGHGEIPIATTVKHKVSVYWDQILRAVRAQELEDALDEMSENYRNKKVDDQTFLQETIQRLQRVSDLYAETGKTVTLGEMADELWEDYELSKSGDFAGIEIDPKLKVLTDSLRKLEPSHITTIVARTGVGKTWLALIIAVHAAMTGSKVLIASMEMSRKDLSRRMVAIALLMNFDAIKRGYLKADQETRYKAALRDMKKRKGFWNNITIMQPSEIRSVISVSYRAKSVGAELVIADAFYMYPGPQEQRWQRIEANLADVRRLTLITGQHWILTAQFNKKAKGVKSADEFAMGGSDSFNQDSNNVIYMIQTKRFKRQKAVILQIGKGRDCETQVPWLHKWNFLEMDWTAMGQHTPGEGGPTAAQRAKL
jgi:replicative DNA helicase